MHKSLLISFLLLICGAYPAAAQTYLLELDQQHIPLPASTTYRVDQVVDARLDRSRLGAVYQGMGNVLTSANFARPFEPTLLELAQRALPGPSARPVSMRVHILSIGEDIRTSSETGTVELVVDFLEKRGQSYALLLTHGETLESGGLDVTNKHAALLTQGVYNALTKLAALPTEAPAIGALLSEDELNNGKGGPAELRYPIQQEPLQRGIYKTFEEFRSNRPGITQEPFVLTYRKRTGKQWAGADDVAAEYLYMSPDKPRRPVRNAWGLCDGKKIYILHRGDLFELQPSGPYYTFTGVTPANSSDVMLAGAVGGLAGVALASAISGGQPRPYELHMSSGRVVASAALDITDDKGFARADTAAIYLYRRSDSMPAQALTIMVGDKEVGTLLPNSYLALSWSDRRRQIALCARGTQQACHSFVPDFASATYLECSIPSASDEMPAFKQVITKEGVFYVKKFRVRNR